MTEQTQAVTLEDLKRTYQPASGESTHATFDRVAVSQRQARISKSPSVSQSQGVGELHKQFAEIQLGLVDLADDYGKMNVRFKTVLGKNAIYKVGDLVGIAWYSMPIVKNKQRVREIRSTALGRRGDSLEVLVSMMGEIVNDAHQKAIEGKTKSQTLQVEVVQHTKYLYDEFVKNLKAGNYRTVDATEAEKEAQKIYDDLKKVESVVLDLEGKIREAKSKGDLDVVKKISDQMTEALSIQRGILDGRMAADGKVSEIRRQILDSAEGVEAAKGAIAASAVNYEATNALIDSFNELEIKYRHAKDYMIPVFMQQAKVSTLAWDAVKMKEALMRMSVLSQRLMESNIQLVKHLSASTFELLKTPVYDVDKCKALEADIAAYKEQLNREKMEWADGVQTVLQPEVKPGYVKV